MYILPFTVMIFSTLLTVKKLVFRPTLTNHQFARSARRNRRISIMLLFMCLTYMVTTLPNRLCFSLFLDKIIDHEYSDTVILATNTLMYSRCAINVFFLYISVHGFRRDMRDFILKCCEGRVRQVHPTNQTLSRDVANTRTPARVGDGIASIELLAINNS